MNPWLVASATLLLAASSQPATAALLIYQANLSGASEVPPAATPGSGSTLVTFNTALQTLRVQVDFQNLIAPTTAAHIHVRANPSDQTGGVVTQTPSFAGFPVGVTSGSYDQTFDMTLPGSYNPSFLGGALAGGSTAVAFAYILDGLADGRAYVNVHTTSFPAGEIRGDLAAPSIPEPGTWSLLIAGFGLTGAALRRRYRLGRYATSVLPGCWPKLA